MTKLIQQLKWYYFTRGIGIVTALYELMIDRSSERGTIILAAFGIMGFDWVSRREKTSDGMEQQEREDQLKKREKRLEEKEANNG